MHKEAKKPVVYFVQHKVCFELYWYVLKFIIQVRSVGVVELETKITKRIQVTSALRLWASNLGTYADLFTFIIILRLCITISALLLSSK